MNLSRFSFRRLDAAGAFACIALVGATAALGGEAGAATGARKAVVASPRCTTSGLVVWLNTQGNAGAGSAFYNLEFTNLSGHPCTLVGYPGLSAVDLGGHRLGSAAARTPSPVHVVHLANGATASAAIRIVGADNFPSSTCHQVTAAGLRVFPPNQTASKVVAFPFRPCSATGLVYLDVKAVA
jgi:hypothetical protein